MFNFLYLDLKTDSSKSTDGSENTIKIKDVKKVRNISIIYIFVYIVPIIGFDFLKIGDVILFTFFMLMLIIVIHKNRIFDGNIVLELLKYSYYDCKIDERFDIKCELRQKYISKINLFNYIDYKLYEKNINDDYYLITKIKN